MPNSLVRLLGAALKDASVFAFPRQKLSEHEGMRHLRYY